MSDRRDTFVGTAQYVSPEMLKDSKAGPASDLWALGCIIFKMLTGEVPFSGTTTFQQILERKLHFPDYLSPQARDLIDKLLQLDPETRLGATVGSGYSESSFKELKSHPFF